MAWSQVGTFKIIYNIYFLCRLSYSKFTKQCKFITFYNAHSIGYSCDSKVLHKLKTYFTDLRHFSFKLFITLLFGLWIFIKSSIAV